LGKIKLPGRSRDFRIGRSDRARHALAFTLAGRNRPIIRSVEFDRRVRPHSFSGPGTRPLSILMLRAGRAR
jgi:hypothetical protein